MSDSRRFFSNSANAHFKQPNPPIHELSCHPQTGKRVAKLLKHCLHGKSHYQLRRYACLLKKLAPLLVHVILPQLKSMSLKTCLPGATRMPTCGVGEWNCLPIFLKGLQLPDGQPQTRLTWCTYCNFFEIDPLFLASAYTNCSTIYMLLTVFRKNNANDHANSHNHALRSRINCTNVAGYVSPKTNFYITVGLSQFVWGSGVKNMWIFNAKSILLASYV